MKKNAFVIIFSCTLFFSSTVRAEIVNKIIAVVNDEIITQRDLNKFFLPLKLQLQAEHTEEELESKLKEEKENLFKKMIQDKLLLEDVERNNITVSDEVVEERLQEIKQGFYSEQEFLDTLSKSDMNISDLRQRYKEQLLIEKLIFREIKSKIIVKPKDITKYYEKHKEEFWQPERVKLRQIFIPKEENEALRKIKMVKGLLNERIKFDNVAKKYSQGPSSEQGGLLGIKRKGELISEIDQVVFSLETGEISDIIITNFGYHIFKIDEKFPAGSKSLSELSQRIKNILFGQKAQQKFQEYLNNLYEKSYISIQK